jgi:putative ABC transport system permease protein
VRQDGLDKELRAGIYTSYQQSVPFSADLAVWAKRGPYDLVDPVRKVILSVDPTVPVSHVRTMDKLISDAVLPPRLIFLLVSSLAAIAMLLALLGIYALLSYRVTQGTRELALRMALGAQSGDLLKWVLSRGLLLTGAGQVAGVMISIALTRYLQSQLYGVSPTDVQTFVLVCLVVFVAAVLACLVPACKATRVSPARALKCD